MSIRPYEVRVGDCLASLRAMPAESVHCAVTSPPYYGLRDYGCEGQIGLEDTPQAYVERMVDVFREVRRVLRRDGTCWLNIGDSYAGSWGAQSRGDDYPGTLEGGKTLYARQIKAHPKRTGTGSLKNAPGLKPKDRMMIPHRVALALQADGWWVRDEIIWHKPSPMPTSVTDRTTPAHEPIFLLSRSARYYYDADAIREGWADDRNGTAGGVAQTYQSGRPDGVARRPIAPPRVEGRNARSVWRIAPEPYAEAHFATFPSELPRRCIAAGTSDRGCCPACGSPWRRRTAREAKKRSRPNDLTKRAGENGTGNHCANTVAGVAVRTLGWEPSCGCDAGDPVGCVVLDPFSGSGTTGAVAVRMGRRYIGLELNPEYARLSETRIGQSWKGAAYRDETKATDAPLFAEVGL